MESEAYRLMTKARGQLYQSDRFYGTLAMHLELMEDPTCKTAWTDGISIGFNPEYVLRKSDYGRMFVFKHEVWHPLLGHHTRRGDRDPGMWNEAADRRIHYDFVHREGMKLIPGVLYDPTDGLLSTEGIYAKVFREKKAEAKKPKPSSGQQDGKESKNENEDVGEVRDLPSGKGKGKASRMEKVMNEAKWMTALERAVKEGSGFGHVPAYARDLLEAKKRVMIDWTEVLSRFVQDSLISENYNWMKPSKKFIGQDIFMPTLAKGDELGTMVFGIDTSASMNLPALEQCIAELNRILETYECTVVVLLCDTKVHKDMTFTPEDLPVKVEAIGRGGTHFSPVFNWVKENMDETPTCLLYYTDGDGRFPEVVPDYPVLWIGTQKFNPPFGEFVPITVS